jgi:hypothetical protein
MEVYKTGIRSGEYITSSNSGKQNRGSILQVEGFYPPSKSALPTDDYSWSIYLQQLESVPFFAGLSHSERKDWLIKNSTDDSDLYLQEVPLRIRIVKLEGAFFTEKLDQSTIDRLVKGNPDDPNGFWDLSYVYNIIPRKPGSRAARHTLIFRPGNWQLYNAPLENLGEFSGIVVDLDQGNFYAVEQSKVDYVVNVSDVKFGIRTGRGVGYPNIEPWSLLNWASPSIHKSLIQKIIRTGTSEITHDGTSYSGSSVLRTSFLMLLKHPGAFVPDIQRFVTGQESALKRLAVSICEDSYTEQYNEIMCLLTAALLTQVNKEWKPTHAQIDRWLILAEQSRADKRRFTYSTREHVFPSEYNYYTVSYLLLRELRSFETDINMLSTITGKYEVGGLLVESIPLIHCIDQHNITDIGYYLPEGTVGKFTDLFKMIWDKSSGINPRRGQTLVNDNTLKCIRFAQKSIWDIKTVVAQSRPITDAKVEIEYTLSDQWLAGMLGTISLQMGRSLVLLTLHPDDIFTFIPVKKPARGDKDIPQLSPEEQATAIMQAQKYLSTGVPLSAVPESLPIFKGSKLYLTNGSYIIMMSDGSMHNWNDIKHMRSSFNVHPELPLTLSNSIKWNGIGISANADQLINDVLNTKPDILRRLLMFMSSARSTISLFKISRDGTGQEYAVSPLDNTISHILSKLTLIYPGAIYRLNTHEYQVIYGPLIWRLRDMILERLNKTSTLYGVNEWGKIYDHRNRTLWPHQETGWQKMMNNRGHLLWIPVGLGKTIMVLRYLQHLIEQGQMPKYVLYTLPPSAIENTVKEIEAFGIRVHLMDLRMTAKLQERQVLPFTINLVKHDHLRMGAETFRSIADQAFVIVDEFHLTLNKTLRTSMALELVKTSIDFIGLSGTIVQSENIEDLVQWLQQIVDFEVTTDNFWVAVSAMISNRVDTGVKVVHYSHELPLPDDKKVRYLSLVNASLGGHNPNPRGEDFREAVAICHEICREETVRLTMEYYNTGESIFVVSKDKADQERIQLSLLGLGVPGNEIVLLGSDQSVAISSGSTSPVRIVITTIRHSTGYTFTKARIMITSVYFSNQATREQLEGRINRIGQTAPEVYVVTIHVGVLTHLLKKYDEARSLSQALKQLADEI